MTQRTRGASGSTARRRLAALGAALVATLALTPGIAFADAQTGTYIDGEYLASRGPNSASGYMNWNGSGSVDNLNGLRVTGDGAFLGGDCLDSIYDWRIGTGEESHFDARRVRTCKSTATYTATSYDHTSGSNLLGMQKAGVCYGPNNNNNTQAGYCSNDTRAVQTVLRYWDSAANKYRGPNPVLPNPCTKSWIIDGAGMFHGDGGGDPQDCNG